MTVKGSARPITLYTLDIAEDETNLRLAEALDPTVLPSDEQAEAEERALREKISTLHAMEDDGTDADLVDPEQFEAEKEALKELDQEARMFKRTNAIFEMRRTTTEEFMEAWDEALRLYLGGKWPEAIVCFRKCKALVPDDGPTDTLMTYLERRNCEAPAGWNGGSQCRPRLARAAADRPCALRSAVFCCVRLLGSRADQLGSRVHCPPRSPHVPRTHPALPSTPTFHSLLTGVRELTSK